jgi:hypothetical protein
MDLMTMGSPGRLKYSVRTNYIFKIVLAPFLAYDRSKLFVFKSSVLFYVSITLGPEIGSL